MNKDGSISEQTNTDNPCPCRFHPNRRAVGFVSNHRETKDGRIYQIGMYGTGLACAECFIAAQDRDAWWNQWKPKHRSLV